LSIIEKTPGIQMRSIVLLFENVSGRTIERQISILVKEGRIERRGSKKTGGYWKIEGDNY
jgi:predicted HTH transcriptional regulator